MAQSTAIATTVGTKSSSSGRTVSKVLPVATNSRTKVQCNPDFGRIVMRDAAGYEYSSVPSITSNGVTIILEAS